MMIFLFKSLIIQCSMSNCSKLSSHTTVSYYRILCHNILELLCRSMTSEDTQRNEHDKVPLNHNYQALIKDSSRNRDDEIHNTSTTSNVKAGNNRSRECKGLQDDVKVNDVASTRNKENNGVGIQQENQIEGDKVSPALLGYEKMEWLDDPYINSQVGDRKITEALGLNPSSYVKTEDNGIVVLDMTKGDGVETREEHCMAGGNNVITRENVTFSGENVITREENVMDRPKNEMIKGENETTITEYEMTKGENVSNGGENVMSREDNTIARGENVMAREDNTIARGENVMARGENETTGGENVMAREDNTIIRGENMMARGENETTGGENVMARGENVMTGGENVMTTGGQYVMTRGENVTMGGQNVMSRGENGRENVMITEEDDPYWPMSELK